MCVQGEDAVKHGRRSAVTDRFHSGQSVVEESCRICQQSLIDIIMDRLAIFPEVAVVSKEREREILFLLLPSLFLTAKLSVIAVRATCMPMMFF